MTNRSKEGITLTKKLVTALTIFALVFGLAACGGDDDSSDTTEAATTATTEDTTATEAGGSGGSSGGGETVSFEADPGGALAYTEDKVTAKAGDATIEFDNPASIPHDVVIEDDAGKEIAATEVITGSNTSTDATLDKGTFTYFCSVPGHREAGMEGTLTVK